MIICVCKAVSEREIRAAVRDGANCVRDLTQLSGLGSCCGKCVPEARAVLGDALTRIDAQALQFSATPKFA